MRSFYNSDFARSIYRNPVGRFLYHFPTDAIDTIFRRREDLVPPRWRMFSGRGNFKAIGREFLAYFIEYGQLTPSDKVLDVGCGMGRMAAALTTYLDSRGEYEGFDCVRAGVSWCNRNIHSRFPNFRFHFLNVRNQLYNPKGIQEPDTCRFPYEDSRFDFVFLTSVFTHMLPAGVDHYLGEVARVLQRRGRCLITYNLINEESLGHLSKGFSRLDFTHKGAHFLSISRKVPEYNVALDEQWVRERYAEKRLEIKEPIQYGAWCGRRAYLSEQDIIIGTKQ